MHTIRRPALAHPPASRFALFPSLAIAALLALASRPAAGEDPPAAAATADPAAARQFFEKGEVLREEMKWDEAAKAYADSLDKDESAWSTHVRFQEVVLRIGAGGNLQKELADLVKDYDDMVAGRPNDAALKVHRLRLEPVAARLATLLKMLKDAPSDPMLLLETGRAQLASGDPAAAKKSLDLAAPAAPDRAEAFLLSVEAQRRSGDAVGARTRLENAVKQSPQDFEAILALGRLAALEGKHEEALQHAQTVLHLRTTHLPAMLLRSETSSRLKKNEDALQALENALRVNPAAVEVQLAWADLTERTGTPEALKRAVEAYTKAAAAGGGFRAQYGLGWAQERLLQFAEAEKAYREALLHAPSDAAVVNSIGYVLLRQKKFSDAKTKFQQAIDLAPESPEAYANMGSVLEEQSEWNEAIKVYQRLFKIKGQDKNVRALINCAFDYEALGTYQKAQELLEKVRVIKPDDSEIATFLADNLYFQHKWKLAIKVYQDAVRLDEKNRFAWRGMGAALAQDDKPEDAVSALEKAKALKADDQNVLLLLGDLYVNLENLEKALENYQAYVKAGGNNPEVPRLIEEIAKEIEDSKK